MSKSKKLTHKPARKVIRSLFPKEVVKAIYKAVKHGDSRIHGDTKP